MWVRLWLRVSEHTLQDRQAGNVYGGAPENMAYAKAVAYQTSMNDPVSKSLATFMLDTLNTTRTIE